MRRAICNELFGELDFSESLRIIRETGFPGVEIAPHTLYGNFRGNIQKTTSLIRSQLDGEGVDFAGLHWLLVGPPDLHVCSPDEATRTKSWDHIRRLSDIGGELGGGPMTLGSPAQRSSLGPMETTMEYFKDGLSAVADYIEGTGCSLLVETLPAEFTDVVNTLDEARAVIDEVGKAGVGGMFDFHNTDDETEPWDELILGHRNYISHVHLNDAGGTAPTLLTDDYIEAFRALAEIEYEKWISLEIFSVPEDPAAVLKQVADFLTELEV